MSTFSDDVSSVVTSGSIAFAAKVGTNGADLDQTVGNSAIVIIPTTTTNTVTITNASFGQATTVTIPDPGVASASFVLAQSSAAAGTPALITQVVTASAAALASAGKVAVMNAPSASSKFGIYSMRVIKSTGISGNSGDRLLALTDGTIVFNGSGVTAALLGTPITTRPGGTGNPDCGTAVDPTASTAGANIYLQYTGGTTDYNAGSVKLEVVLYQVAA